MSDAQNRGKGFEWKISSLLKELQIMHPLKIHIKTQPRLTLHDGQEVIPDFELQFDLLFEKACYLIECQNRKRSTPQIAQKIRYIKSLSNRNRFIFVHAQNIPETTQKVLEADGVMIMSFEELAAFVAKLELQIRSQSIYECIEEMDKHHGNPKEKYDENILKHSEGINPDILKLPYS